MLARSYAGKIKSQKSTPFGQKPLVEGGEFASNHCMCLSMKRFARIFVSPHRLAGVLSIALLASPTHAAVTVTPDEMLQKSQWMRQNFRDASHVPPFSFTYDGNASADILPSWQRSDKNIKLGDQRIQHVTTWTRDALQVRCVAVDYNDFPMVEWTVYLKNISATNSTFLLQDIEALNTTFSRSHDGEFVLHGNKGDSTTPDSYEPYHLTLTPSSVTNFSPLSFSGKSSCGPAGWPYYNLQMPGGGIILAIGWPGQWASSFTRDAGNNVRIVAGQEYTHLILKPGEEIRTPLIAILFWKGNDLVRAQNLWRRWYIAHEIPRINGVPTQPAEQIQVAGNSTAAVDAFLKVGIKPDVCWRDAGGSYTWYPNSTGPYKGDDSWLNTGTWDVDPKRYPDGFKPFSDWIHARGMQFLLWFEPERAGDPGSWLGVNHPEWLLPGEFHGDKATTANDAELHLKNLGNTHGSILNEGNPEAFHWLTNHIEHLIQANGIDWYREDMNGDGPLAAWRIHDTKDRQGITENFYVQGHLAYWDALLAMNPKLQIDSCASGGRRNDLETMRRAVPFTRSDFQFPEMPNCVDGNQCHTWALSSWLPYQGSGCRYYDPYSYRSFYMSEYGMTSQPTPENTVAQQKSYAECKQIAPLMTFGDYYPLTDYDLGHKVWIAWQFDRPEKGDGVVQAFRRGECDESKKIFRLHGLDPKARYELKNFDVEGSTEMTGEELMEKGLPIELNQKPGSAIITYQRVKK
jgi:alpha-galactosidase